MLGAWDGSPAVKDQVVLLSLSCVCRCQATSACRVCSLRPRRMDFPSCTWGFLFSLIFPLIHIFSCYLSAACLARGCPEAHMLGQKPCVAACLEKDPLERGGGGSSNATVVLGTPQSSQYQGPGCFFFFFFFSFLPPLFSPANILGSFQGRILRQSGRDSMQVVPMHMDEV